MWIDLETFIHSVIKSERERQIFSNISYMWNLEKWYATGKSLQSCPTLGDPIDGSPPGSLLPGILQARTLEWISISFSNGKMV